MQVIVYRGHTVTTPTGTYKPGDMVELADDEAQRLIALGIVHRPGEEVLVTYVDNYFIPHTERRETLRERGTTEHNYQPAPALGRGVRS